MKFIMMLPLAARNSIENVGRQLATKTNANSNQGVLVGKWEGSYAGGTQPMAWSSSSQLINAYLRQVNRHCVHCVVCV
jgi:hypothetical protein